MTTGTRQAERLHHEVLVAYRTPDGFLTDWAVNISKGGLFVNTRSPLGVGTAVKLLISLPDGSAPFELQGKVSWAQPPDGGAVPGMGIEFLELDEAKRDRIESFVEKLRVGLAGD